MVGKIGSYNQIQKLPTQIRGGVFTAVGSGSNTEAEISQGGWKTYRPAVGHRAIIRGKMGLVALGSNIFMELTMFDNVNGRTIAIARVDATQTSDDFEFEVDRDITLNARGDNVADDGSFDCIAFVREVQI